ncbi:hypothetical protein CEXT_223391 [Caerostris extrusa]|uniref:Uncharacterized protein n=1 Tax=Caerostris extrusa TaxID=172846 RepID=A0AAV4YDG9_CAEEX|nr:hypothetical protein CEXT_223391 [Caerostris extrusa]
MVAVEKLPPVVVYGITWETSFQCAEHIQMWVSHGTLSPLFYFRKCLLIAVLSDLICNYFGRRRSKNKRRGLVRHRAKLLHHHNGPKLFCSNELWAVHRQVCVKKRRILPTFNSLSQWGGC